MTRARRLRLALALGALTAAVGLEARYDGDARAQQLGEGMVRSGTVGIESEAERLLFSSLICTCGCPREALSTCTCGIAAERRDVLRGKLAKGERVADIQAEYAKEYGAQALAVPRNEGANRLVWMLPLAAVVLGAVGVGAMMRRWQKAAPPAPARVTTTAKRDAYDDKLDQELEDLDRE